MIEMRLLLDPVPCPRPRMSRQGRVYYPARYSRFKAAARKLMPGLCFEAGVHTPVKYPVMVLLDLVVTRPKKTKLQHPKPDIDNYIKSVLDSMTSYCFLDDTQVVALDATKRWSSPGSTGYIGIQMTKVTL